MTNPMSERRANTKVWVDGDAEEKKVYFLFRRQTRLPKVLWTFA